MKVLNADCMDYMKTMSDNSVDAVITDIPYDGVNMKRNASRGIRIINKGIADEMTFNLSEFLDECMRVCKGNILIFCGGGQVSEIYTHFLNSGMQMPRVGAWLKSNPSPMNGEKFYVSGIESCVAARKSGAYFNSKVKSLFFNYPVESDKVSHSTPKNRNMMMEIIQDLCPPNGIVLDPCAGSFSTGIACHKLGRDFIMIEKNKEYFDAAVKETEITFNQQNLFK